MRAKRSRPCRHNTLRGRCIPCEYVREGLLRAAQEIGATFRRYHRQKGIPMDYGCAELMEWCRAEAKKRSS